MENVEKTDKKEIKTTCLNRHHRELGATMVEFGGFDMPIEYPGAGIVAEHNAVRTKAGMFDVSHMGEVLVEGTEAQKFVNHIFTNNVSVIEDGAILYGMMLNHKGGVVDDLLVYRVKEDKYFLVINASNIEKDVKWIEEQSRDFDVKITDCSDKYGEIALQGPDAEKVMEEILNIRCADLTFYTFRFVNVGGEDVIVSRTGYTGEDGFEIYASHALIINMWEKLIENGVQPCGLGCRDTLRFEAGLPLYGDELTDDITPVEAALSMFCKLDKEHFIGRDVIAHQKEHGVARKSVGLEISGPAIARHGYEVLDENQNVIGYVTTGYRSITLDKNIAMALIDVQYSKIGTPVFVKVRKKVFPATVIKKRFYTPNYKK